MTRSYAAPRGSHSAAAAASSSSSGSKRPKQEERRTKYRRSEDIQVSERKRADSRSPERKHRVHEAPNAPLKAKRKSISSSRGRGAAASSSSQRITDTEDEEEDEEEERLANPYFESEAEDAGEDYQESGDDDDDDKYRHEAAEAAAAAAEAEDRAAKRRERAANMDVHFKAEMKKEKEREKAARAESKAHQELALKARHKRDAERRANLRRGINWAAGNRTSTALALRRAPGDQLVRMLAPSTPEAREIALQAAVYWAANKVLRPTADYLEQVVSQPKRKENEDDAVYAKRVARRKLEERTKRVSGSHVKAHVQRAIADINPCLAGALYRDMRSSWVVELDRIRREQQERHAPKKQEDDAFEAAKLLMHELRVRKESDSFAALSRERQDKLRAELLSAEVNYSSQALARKREQRKKAKNTLERALAEKEAFKADCEEIEAHKHTAQVYADAVRMNDISSDMENKMRAAAAARVKDEEKKEAAEEAAGKRVLLVNSIEVGSAKKAFEAARAAEKLAAQEPSDKHKADLKAAKASWKAVHRDHEEWKKMCASATAKVAKWAAKLKAKKDGFAALEERIKRNKRIAQESAAAIAQHISTLKRCNALARDDEAAGSEDMDVDGQ